VIIDLIKRCASQPTSSDDVDIHRLGKPRTLPYLNVINLIVLGYRNQHGRQEDAKGKVKSLWIQFANRDHELTVDQICNQTTPEPVGKPKQFNIP
jgi:hypothetical protein